MSTLHHVSPTTDEGPAQSRRALARCVPDPDAFAAVWGRAALLATARAWAWLAGRNYVTPDDVKALARPTLRHRLQLRPEAELEGVTVDAVLETVLATVAVPR